METIKKFYFSGIGGSGMSALAQVLRQRGHWVGGSDRSYDRKINLRFFRKLKQQGIVLFPQREDSLPVDIDCIVVSTAVEKSSGEIKKAASLGIAVLHRAQLLADLFNASCGIGIAGTSGKTTVTGMVASILEAAKKDPTVINGGIIKQYVSPELIGNAKNGSSDYLVSEVDESDGSIIHFQPEIGLITNISKDHKEMGELKELFRTFIANTAGQIIINGDCAESMMLKPRQAITFGLRSSCTVSAEQRESCGNGSSFMVQGTLFSLRVPGVHNVYNALAAIAAGLALSVPLRVMQKGLFSFKGIKRRLDLVGTKNGICVVDDFAHNPDKIAASISALKSMGKRMLVLFQPHGYGPTKFLLKELGCAFSSSLGPSDVLLCLKIYDAGGTADRSVTAMDLLHEVKGPRCLYAQERSEALALLQGMVQPGDVIAVMGARDDTLSAFARRIFREITAAN
ncbi:MAG: UDP-N-acetylmuramate--L-alanine ligase [Pseudomonadota bacterium]